MSRRHGFTLVELMVTCTILGILVNLALPAIAVIRRKADAARVVADMHTIRIAALNHFAELQFFPATQPWATPPGSMVRMLPQGFQWTYKTAEYRWSRWSLPNGLPSSPGQTVLIGVEIRTPDQKLMAAIKGLYKGAVTFGTNTQVTFIIE